ncbi:hypothetical protein MIN45_P0310 [Methylomarinovum tepidoasis]|uniref:Glycoside-hydrolase family GH114 TIM-barrel domain-containing protein n=1 Tax=Methylomarinovum tepidoasis TaxID=2840183 RepID=A0AAU9BWY3_9GAMM|nr:endo alpha-1,4 polygalactosaminidase [Methylomarinovum sp. IN45]BCX87943.1 hypothetical protein MIN45_P0310 [Methylomarinovum sp. IN45]
MRQRWLWLCLWGVASVQAASLSLQVRQIGAFYRFSITEEGEVARHHQVYVDSDADATTGFPLGEIGAEYLLENGLLYRYLGDGWQWEYVGVVEVFGNDLFIDWQVAKSDLAGADSMVAVAMDLDADWNMVRSSAPTVNQGPIWRPGPQDTWHWQLTGQLDTDDDSQIFDIDLFDTPTTTIAALHREGKKVVCYFSAGSFENWRPDAGSFPDSVKGEPLEGWYGEWWLDVRQIDVLASIMQRRLDLAKAKGCDGVEPDNVDAYGNSSGFPLTREDQLRYNRFLARWAHERGLAVALKNALELVEELEPDFDWALNEQCFEYDECDRLLPFVTAGKAVWGVTYVDRRRQGRWQARAICPEAQRLGFLWQIRTWDLDDWKLSCGDI